MSSEYSGSKMIKSVKPTKIGSHSKQTISSYSSVWLLVEAFKTLGVNALVVVCRNREVFHEALAWQTVRADVQESPKTAE